MAWVGKCDIADVRVTSPRAVIDVPDRRYVGAWVGNLRHGDGVMADPNGERHEGGFVHGARHGRAIARAKTGMCREGEWAHDVFKRWHGKEQFGMKRLVKTGT